MFAIWPKPNSGTGSGDRNSGGASASRRLICASHPYSTLRRIAVAAASVCPQSLGIDSTSKRHSTFMQLTPLIAVHMTAALCAIAIGPIALWARKGATQRPKLHRAFGYAWVTMMLVAALSAIFIRDFRLPNIAGYTPIHLFVPVTFYYLFNAFRCLAQGNIAGHRKAMQSLYISACLIAGAFTLLPSRYLGNLVFGQWLGVISTNYQLGLSYPQEDWCRSMMQICKI